MSKRLAALFLCLLISECANISKENTSGSNNTIGNGSNPAGVLANGLYLADLVIHAPGHTGTGFYDATRAINGIRGAGLSSGSLDVFSLDNSGISSQLVVAWSGKKVKNGPGIDFIVFENAFLYPGNPLARFMDLAFVEVSNDNVNYCGFAPDYTNVPETAYSTDPTKWLRFAGKTPVLYNIDSNNLTAAQTFLDSDANSEPDLAGGDAFDLALLSADNTYGTGCSLSLRDDLVNNGFTYLRLVPAARRNNPATSAPFVTDGASNGPDFDGVLARYIQ